MNVPTRMMYNVRVSRLLWVASQADVLRSANEDVVEYYTRNGFYFPNAGPTLVEKHELDDRSMMLTFEVDVNQLFLRKQYSLLEA